jgi:hypothetical protein
VLRGHLITADSMSMNRTLRPTGMSIVSRSATVRTEINRLAHSYTAPAQAALALKLQGRTRWFYWLLFAGLVAALAAPGLDWSSWGIPGSSC